MNISLTNSPELVIVDEKNYERVSLKKWCMGAWGQVVRTDNGQSIAEFLLGRAPDGFWDHIDRNRLNNLESNLRSASASQNSANRGKYQGKFSSKYKGVSWHNSRNKWEAHIKVDYKKIYLGLFVEERDAALMYNTAAIKYFGEFAVLNVIESEDDSTKA